MKKQQKGWNPLRGMSEVVDGIVEAPSLRKPKKTKEPAKVDHERVVIYLTPTQAYNLRKTALDRHIDTSALAREILAKAGL